MRYKLKVLCVFIAITICTVAMNAVAASNDKGSNELGQKVFQANCTACHDKGENTIEPTKTLKSSALKENGFNGIADIKKRVQEGKGVMPVFSDRLKVEEINAVAGYVWAESQKDWK